jgi:hypothetical protein
VLIQLIILEGIEIEDDPLEMYNQYIRSFCNKCSFANIDFLFASTALVIVDDFTLNERS